MVLWDTRGIIYYLEKGLKINGDYYASLLDRFTEEIKEKRHLPFNTTVCACVV